MVAEATELCLHFEQIMHFLIRSKDFVLLSLFVSVCKRWKDCVCTTLVLGPDNNLKTQYLAIANAFTMALSTSSMLRFRIFGGGLTRLQAGAQIQGCVEHVVDGLQAHLHSRLAVVTCINQLLTITTMLSMLKIHTGLAARRSMWTLLRVLCAHPLDFVLGSKVVRAILGYIAAMNCMRSSVTITVCKICLMDEQDTVVLSAAQLPRAVALIDAYLATWPSTAAIPEDLMVTMLRIDCAEVREWIDGGSLLNM
jgi:hypothetical protein